MSGQRIYRTLDGKYVPEGHEDAAFLAYTEYDKPPKDVTDELAKAGPKSRAKQADKSRSRQSDKGQSED